MVKESRRRMEKVRGTVLQPKAKSDTEIDDLYARNSKNVTAFRLRLAQFRKNPPIVCVPCRGEYPEVTELARRMLDGEFDFSEDNEDDHGHEIFEADKKEFDEKARHDVSISGIAFYNKVPKFNGEPGKWFPSRKYFEDLAELHTVTNDTRLGQI